MAYQTADSNGSPALSVVVPAYNEAERIRAPLSELARYLADHRPDCELVIVDDGSSDGTADLVGSIAPGLPVPVVLLRYSRNRGKGHALRVGFAHSRGARVLFTDADLSTSIEGMERLLHALDEGAPVAIGSRKLEGSNILVRQRWYREWLGRVFTFFVRWLVADVSDATCGFKAFDGEVGRALFASSRIDDWSFDAEILLLARRADLRIAEVAVVWSDSTGSKVNLWRDVMGSLVGLARIHWLAVRGAYTTPPDRSQDEPVRKQHFAGARQATSRDRAGERA